MVEHIHLFQTLSEYKEARENGYVKPWGSLILENRRVNYNKTDEEKLLEIPLTFEIQGNGNIVWKKATTATTVENVIEYSKNGGEWTSITANTTGGTVISVVSGDTVQFRGDNAAYGILGESSTPDYNTFSGTTAQFSVKGNIMSLINSTNFDTLSGLTTSYVFYCLFGNCLGVVSAGDMKLPVTDLSNSDYCYFGMFSACTSLTTAPTLPAMVLADYCYSSMFRGCSALVNPPRVVKASKSVFCLPAMTLADSCYRNMFRDCTSLTQVPKLPATTLSTYCYSFMFNGCTSLTRSPELPATTLAPYCYQQMFQNCTNLVKAPTLPATSLTNYCYDNMFKGCTSLIQAPELPATTSAEYCYRSMFLGCTGLTTVPSILPATTLASRCYQHMFNGCTSLTTAPELPATTLAVRCYESMFSGCTSLTTAPELLVTALTNQCYISMFAGCANLTTAPDLPATTLTVGCYANMFSGCTNLNYIKCLATNISANECITDWTLGVAASGTFVKNPAMSSWPTGTGGIPDGWTVQDAS